MTQKYVGTLVLCEGKVLLFVKNFLGHLSGKKLVSIKNVFIILVIYIRTLNLKNILLIM